MDMAWLKLAALGPAMLAAVITAGCSPSPGPGGAEHIVFSVANGFGQIGHERTIDVVDVGVPMLHNLTGHSVQLRKVSLLSAPSAVSLLNVTAHTGAAVGIIRGDLTKLCGNSYPSYPVTAAVTAPRADSNWDIVLAMTFAKPGRYYLRRVKIYYTTTDRPTGSTRTSSPLSTSKSHIRATNRNSTGALDPADPEHTQQKRRMVTAIIRRAGASDCVVAEDSSVVAGMSIVGCIGWCPFVVDVAWFRRCGRRAGRGGAGSGRRE